MEINKKLYPYPVLSNYNDDYVDSKFDIDVSYEITEDTIDFEFSAHLNNVELSNLINEKKAFYAVHIECPKTSFRQIVKFREKHASFQVLPGSLNEIVQVCPFIILDTDIKKYENKNFNSLYNGISFNLYKHNIIGIGVQKDLRINKDYDEIKDVSSIFSIVPLRDIKETEIKVELFSERITIKIPFKEFRNYQVAERNENIVPVLHSMLVLPVLTEIFEKVKLDDDAFESQRWFSSLEKAVDKLGYELTSQGLEGLNSFELAQKLFDFPVTKSLNSLAGMILARDVDEDE